MTIESAISEAAVLVRRQGAVGLLSLNRPRALNALTAPMIAAMTDALLSWIDDDAVTAVIIDHAGERGFCAGGDIRAVAALAVTDMHEVADFFLAEYRLNHLLFAYPKPVVAIMDGVTMGGGVGLAWPAAIRIATERTVWAMPETGIGLFPDIGAGWYCPRLAGEAGAWLALTGARFKAADCMALGLATHYAPASAVAGIRHHLAAGGEPRELSAFTQPAGAAPVAEHLEVIDRLFGSDSVEGVLDRLSADGGDWAAAQAARLHTLCPFSLKVTLLQMRRGRSASGFAEQMATEFRLAVHLCGRGDFAEGVRTVVIDKDNAPRWRPAALEAVDDAMVEAAFAPLENGREWTPLPGI